MKNLFYIFLLLGFITTSFATSYAKPEPKKIYSENKTAYIYTYADNKGLAVYESNNPVVPYYFIEVPIWHHNYFVSDNGEIVIIVHWRYCSIDFSEEPAIQIYKMGKLEKEFSYKEFNSFKKPTPPAPIGESIREWYESVEQKNGKVIITLLNKKTVTLSLNDGKKSD